MDSDWLARWMQPKWRWGELSVQLNILTNQLFKVWPVVRIMSIILNSLTASYAVKSSNQLYLEVIKCILQNDQLTKRIQWHHRKLHRKWGGCSVQTFKESSRWRRGVGKDEAAACARILRDPSMRPCKGHVAIDRAIRGLSTLNDSASDIHRLASSRELYLDMEVIARRKSAIICQIAISLFLFSRFAMFFQ